MATATSDSRHSTAAPPHPLPTTMHDGSGTSAAPGASRRHRGDDAVVLAAAQRLMRAADRGERAAPARGGDGFAEALRVSTAPTGDRPPWLSVSRGRARPAAAAAAYRGVCGAGGGGDDSDDAVVPIGGAAWYEAQAARHPAGDAVGAGGAGASASSSCGVAARPDDRRVVERAAPRPYRWRASWEVESDVSADDAPAASAAAGARVAAGAAAGAATARAAAAVTRAPADRADAADGGDATTDARGDGGASAAGAGCSGASAAAPRAPRAADASDSDDSDDDGSSTSGSSDSDSDAGASQFSVDCERCSRHIRRFDDGARCESDRCRNTLCTTCQPAPAAAPAWWCRVHDAERAAAARPAGPSPAAVEATAATASAEDVSGTMGPAPRRVRDLPDCVDSQGRAAAKGVASALDALGPEWKNDPDLVGIADDLADTLAFSPATTSAKGVSAVRRFREFVNWLPPRLRDARATEAVVDFVLASFVNARCGVARGSPWTPPRPEPPSVRGETAAVIGLLRLAGVLPADPRGSLPRTRRTLRKCGCCVKHDASPRAYSFAWELEAAWELSVDRSDPREVCVWCCCATALGYLLRPKYVRNVEPHELRPDAPGSSVLRWARDDKTRPAPRPPGAPALRQVPASFSISVVRT